MIGRIVGSYRVVSLLGQGGMGAVYLGEHPGIGSQVAIKILHPRYAGDRAVAERFFNEARAVNLIGHENIVKIIDFNVTSDQRHFLVMEFLHGRTLQGLLEPGRPFPFGSAGPILVQCCSALQAAHDRNIVHRDLKPENIFLVHQLGRANVVKIVDFGIAKLSDVDLSARTQTGTVMGTAAYMSPEQAAGETSSIGPASDIYALGVVMFQLATGRLPFQGTFRKMMLGHLNEVPPLPHSLNPQIPTHLETIILKALEKEPQSRFSSMAEMRRALLGCMQASGIRAELPLAGAGTTLPPESARASLSTKSSPQVTDPGSAALRTNPAGIMRRRWQRRAALGATLAVLALVTAGIVADVLIPPKRRPTSLQPPPAPSVAPPDSPASPVEAKNDGAAPRKPEAPAIRSASVVQPAPPISSSSVTAMAEAVPPDRPRPGPRFKRQPPTAPPSSNPAPAEPPTAVQQPVRLGSLAVIAPDSTFLAEFGGSAVEGARVRIPVQGDGTVSFRSKSDSMTVRADYAIDGESLKVRFTAEPGAVVIRHGERVLSSGEGVLVGGKPVELAFELDEARRMTLVFQLKP